MAMSSTRKSVSTVKFHHANVMASDLLAASAPYDVLFCRNLLIYLTSRARGGVLLAINRLLAADGLLFIGHADRLEWSDGKLPFTAVGAPGLFGYRRANTAADQEPRPHLDPRPWCSV